MAEEILVDDENAGQFWEEYQNGTPERKAQLEGPLIAWDQKRVQAQQQEREKQVKGMFGNVTTLNGTWNPNAYPGEWDDEQKAGVAVKAFLSMKLGKRPEDLIATADIERDRYSKQFFSKDRTSNVEFYANVTKQYETQDIIEAQDIDLQKRVIQQGIKDIEAGTITPVIQTLQAWKESLPPEYQGTRSDMEAFFSAAATAKKLQDDFEPYRESTRQLLITLQQFTEGNDPSDNNFETQKSNLFAVARGLSLLNPKERQKAYVYAAIANPEGADPSFFYNIGEQIVRSFDFIPKGSLASQEDHMIGLVDALEKGTAKMREGSNDLGGITTEVAVQQYSGGFPVVIDMKLRNLTPEEKAKYLAEAKATVPVFQVVREMRAFAKSGIDPIKQLADKDSTLGSAERGMYGFAGSVGFMAAAGTGSLPAIAALTVEEYDRLRLEAPDLDRNTTKALALVSGTAQGALEKLQFETMVGRLPTITPILAQIRNAPLRWLSGFGINLAGQNIQEGLQDAVSIPVDQVASGLSQDMPDKDFSKQFKEWKAQRLDVFFATLIPGLVGGGALMAGDIANPNASIFEPRAMDFVGFSPEQKQAVLSLDGEARWDKYREEWANRKPAMIKEGQRAYRADLQRVQQDQENPLTPTIESATAPDGSRIYVAKAPDGSVIASSPEREFVESAIIHQGEINTKLNEDVNKEIINWARSVDPSVKIEVTGLSKTAQNSLESGDATLEQLRERLELGGMGDKSLGEVNIFGETSIKKLAEDSFETQIKLYDGAGPDTIFEELNHAKVLNALAEGRVTMPQLVDWTKQTEAATGIKYSTSSPSATVESIASIGLDYLGGRIKDRDLPSQLLRYIKQIAAFLADAIKRSVKLKKAFESGKIDTEFESFIAESLGLPLDRVAQRQEQKAMSELLEGTTFAIGNLAERQKVLDKLDEIQKSPDERLRVLEKAKDKFLEIQDENLTSQRANAGDSQLRRSRDKLLNSIGELNAILKVLPAEVRGKVGGFATLSKIGTGDKALSDFFVKRLDMIDKALESALSKEYDAKLKKLLNRAKPVKGKAGEKPKGKAGEDIHELFDRIREFVDKPMADADTYVSGLETAIAKGDLLPEVEDAYRMQVALIPLFADWKNADAARKASAIENGTTVFERGYRDFKNKMLAIRDERRASAEQLRADTGTRGKAAERKKRALADNGLPGTWKDSALGLLNFEQSLKWVFGDSSIEAQRLSDLEREASFKKEDRISDKMNGLESVFTRLAGSRYKGEELRYAMSQPSMEVDGLPLSQNEAIAVTLMWRQEDGKRHMIGQLDENGKPISEWHYDQAFVDEVESNLTPQAREVRQHLIDEYSSEYPALNAIYKDLNGINLPKNDRYSPITVSPANAGKNQMADPVTGTMVSAASTTPGSLRTRGTAIAEPDFRDALQTYIAHTKQIEHWKAYAKFSNEAHAILGKREVGNSVNAVAGDQAVRVLRGWLDVFAQGGTRDASAQLGLNRMVARMSNRAASIALVGRVGTLAVQSTQLAAALAEMPTIPYLSRLGRLFSGQLSWKDAFNSSYIQRRLQEMPPVVRQAVEGFSAEKPTQLRHAVALMGRLIGGADALFTAGTYAIVKDYQMKQAIELGFSGVDADVYATQTAERIVDRIAQPTRLGTRSLFENTTTNPLGRLAWAFASDARKNIALAAYATVKRPLPEKLRALTYVWILNGVISEVVRSAWKDATDDGEDDEIFDDKNWSFKKMALSIATGPFYGVPAVGSMLEYGAFKAAGEYVPQGNMLSGFEQSIGSLKNIDETLAGERETEEVLRDVDNILSGLGLFHTDIAAAASLTHLARQIFGLSENALPEE